MKFDRYYLSEPWLRNTASRGDIIRAISNPLEIRNIFSDISGIPTSVFSSSTSLSNYLKNLSNSSIINQLSFYGIEVMWL